MASIDTVLGKLKAAHRRTLREAGVSPKQLRVALDGGEVRAVRRDWIVGRKCDPLVERALHAGVTLGCVSGAAVLGMWRVDVPEIHVTAARNCPRIDRTPLARVGHDERELLVHWTRIPTAPTAPRVRPIVDGLPRILGQVARCQPLDEAVAVFDSAVRRGITSMPELRGLAASDSIMRRVVEHVHPLADSGIESIPRVRLARRGVVMVPQVKVDGHRVDGLIGERLVLQFDGFGPHRSRKQRNKDLREDGRLVRKGHTVLRFGRDAVLYEWPMIETAVLSVIAQGRHNW